MSAMPPIGTAQQNSARAADVAPESQSGRAPDCRTIGAQRATSARTNDAKSAALIPAGVAPSLSNCACSLGSSSAPRIAVLSRSVNSAESCAGANTPNHAVDFGHAGFAISAHYWQGADGRGRAFRGSATDDTPQQAEAAVSGHVTVLHPGNCRGGATFGCCIRATRVVYQ